MDTIVAGPDMPSAKKEALDEEVPGEAGSSGTGLPLAVTPRLA